MTNRLLSIFIAAIISITSMGNIKTSPIDYISTSIEEAKDESFIELMEMYTKANPVYDINSDYSNVNCLLTTGDVTTLSLECKGVYYIEENNYIINGSSEKPIMVDIFIDNILTAKINNIIIFSGFSFAIRNTAYDNIINTIKLYTSGFDLNNGREYLGDILVSMNNGNIQLINHLPTAFYAYGVVPYEMAESCQLEALKAQAVAVRTFAFAFPSNTTEYNLTDSMNYQGYRGYKPGYTRCMQACIETCGQILFINNKPFITFYAATNGGETALPSWMWGGNQDYAYEVKLDEYDLTYNPSKYIENLHIEYNELPSDERLISLIETNASEIIGSTFTLSSIKFVYMHTPKHEESQRDLTYINFTVTGNDIELSLDIEAAKLKEIGIFTKPYKIYWGEATENGYDIHFCRWGHGVGFSQYGAEMRARAGAIYTELLTFYYGKMTLTNVNETIPEFSDPIPVTTPTPKPTSTPKPTVIPTATPTPIPTATPTATPKPTATPTPVPTATPTIAPTATPTVAPTAMPIMEDTITSGKITASKANMRVGPSTSTAKLKLLAKNTEVIVIGEEDGWIHCIYNNLTGYIRGNLLSVDPSFSIGTLGIATTAKSTPLLNKPTNYSSTTLETISKNHTIYIYGKIGNYYFVRTESYKIGYIKASYLKNIIIYRVFN